MPNQKYDWDAYLPRMIEMYRAQMSIPQIHEAIQDPERGFTPNMVYKKFREAHYPTDPDQRSELLRRLNIASWPSQISMDKKPFQRSLLSATSPASTNGTTMTASKSFSSNSTPSSFQTFSPPAFQAIDDQPKPSQVEAFNQHGTQTPPNAVEELHLHYGIQHYPRSFQRSVDHGSQPLIPIEGRDDNCWASTGAHEPPTFDVEYPPGIFNTPILPSSQNCKEDIQGREKPHAHYVLNCSQPLPRVIEESTIPDRTAPMSIDNDAWQTSEPSPQIAQRPVAINPSPIARRPRNFVGGVVQKCLHPRQRLARSCTPENRYSVATEDSGYASGRSTPLNMLLDVDRPQALNEFEGLHRAPCYLPHEPQAPNGSHPQPQNLFKDRSTCPNCQYSWIHNLSWSARHLGLEVFIAELNLQGTHEIDTVYDVTAVDGVGNTALHYAAAGGASYEYFHALIEAGVNPYHINTAGQLFLHCLRPHVWNTRSAMYDWDLGLFEADLVNLLNTYQPKGAFRWRDNEGETPLDALARRIINPEIKSHIFRLVTSAGYPLEVSNQFQNVSGNTILSPDTKDIVSEISNVCSENGFAMTQMKQNKAWEIFGRASSEPSYVDPETGDNALHALSRLRMSQTRELIHYIENFVSTDVVDLNLHNRDRDCPLAAFIRERPFHGVESDETGATMSKYLDALLWKDVRARIPNRINVNMRNWDGATALYYAAIRGRPDSVRSLIEAGANVNLRVEIDGNSISILQATLNAKARAVAKHDNLKVYLFNNVISYLEHENAVVEPTILEERALCANSVRILPI